MDQVLSPTSAADRVIAKRLYELRMRHCLSQEEMSVITGIPATEIRDMESGVIEVPAAAVFVISYSMGVAPDELMDDEPEAVMH